MAHALRQANIPFEEQVSLTVTFGDLVIKDAGRLDFLVDGKLIIEAKATLGSHPTHAAQMVHYLKASGLPLRLLLNFNVPLLKQGYGEYVHPDLLSWEEAPLLSPSDDSMAR